jgi:hypothetical protein
MKKYFAYAILILIAVASQSCKSVRHSDYHKDAFKHSTITTQVKSSNKYQSLDFIVKDNRLLIAGEVNGEKDTVILDTGTSSAFISFVTDCKEGKEGYKKIPIVSATNKTKVTGKVEMAVLDFPIFVTKQSIMKICFEEQLQCPGKIAITRYGLLGVKPLMHGNSQRITQLDFSNKRISYLPRSQWNDILNQYQQIKSKFKLGVMFVYVEVNGIEYECLFDTGNRYNLILKGKTESFKTQTSGILYEGNYGKDIAGLSGHQFFRIKQEPITTSTSSELNAEVLFVSDISFNNFGMGLIQCFDWAFDFDNEKIYAKPRREMPYVYDTRSPYRILYHNGTLYIAARKVENNLKYAVGTEIHSVNGVAVTKENICDVLNSLNETEDWNSILIQ